MLPESGINLLLQIPLAGIVVLVVVMFLRHLEKVNSQMLMFMSDQATNNREFLKVQREQNNAALARFGEEQKLMRVEMARLTDAVDRVLDKTPVKRNRNV